MVETWMLSSGADLVARLIEYAAEHGVQARRGAGENSIQLLDEWQNPDGSWEQDWCQGPATWRWVRMELGY